MFTDLSIQRLTELRRITTRIASLAAVTLAVSCPVAEAQDVSVEVRLLAASCATCHGHQGRALGVGLSLQGQTAAELYRKLLGYKTGEIKGTIMHQHAKGYSDAELKAMADYFAAVK
jgi:cytochrome subunit of sulfide dehydrogenase